MSEAVETIRIKSPEQLAKHLTEITGFDVSILRYYENPSEMLTPMTQIRINLGVLKTGQELINAVEKLFRL